MRGVGERSRNTRSGSAAHKRSRGSAAHKGSRSGSLKVWSLKVGELVEECAVGERGAQKIKIGELEGRGACRGMCRKGTLGIVEE